MHQSPVLAQSPAGREPLAAGEAVACGFPGVFQLVRIHRVSFPDDIVSQLS